MKDKCVYYIYICMYIVTNQAIWQSLIINVPACEVKMPVKQSQHKQPGCRMLQQLQISSISKNIAEQSTFHNHQGTKPVSMHFLCTFFIVIVYKCVLASLDKSCHNYNISKLYKQDVDSTNDMQSKGYVHK